MQCLDDNAASEFVSGTMPPGSFARAETHLAKCRDCRSLVAALAGPGPDNDHDSQAQTRPHERDISALSRVMPRKYTIGDRVGRYLVLSALGSGGMGVVFSAYDPQLDRKVALKLLRTGLNLSSKEARTRLKREAQAIAQLSHPNVVAVYDVGATDDGDLYIAMELVEGDSLTVWLKKYPRTWREIVDVFVQAGRGLYAAHGTGLLHRDFKPDNVLVGGDGRVRVTDFGLARSVMTPDEGAKPRADMTALQIELTATGTVLGTPRYMAPEQLTSADIDARADQFSFSVALYEALYNVHPLDGGTSVSMLEKGSEASPPPEGAKVPSAIGRVVGQGLSKDPKKRFPTMAALIAELAPHPQRTPFKLALAVFAGVMIAGGAALALYLHREGPPTLSIEDNATNELLRRLNKSEEQRRTMLLELKNARADHAEVIRLREQIEEKAVEIDQLVDQVQKLQTKPFLALPVKPVVKVPAPRDPRIDFSAKDAALRGCFVEWQERMPGKNAEMLVRLSVSPDGVGHSAIASGVDSPSTQHCVASQIASLAFPTGPEQLDLEVRVTWTDGELGHTARVVGHHDAPQTPDLE